MYNRQLVGKTLKEAQKLIADIGSEYTLKRDFYSNDWDTELVVRAKFDTKYHLVTSGFKLKPDEKDRINE